MKIQKTINFVLFILFISSILVLSSIDFNNIISDLFYKTSQYRQSIIISLATGYCISYFIYFLLTLLPSYIEKKRMKPLISKELDSLIFHIEEIIFFILEVYKIDIDVKAIKESDLHIIDGNTDYNNKEISCIIAPYKGGGSGISHSSNINKIIQNNSSHIEKSLDKILKLLSYSTYSNPSLIQLIEDISKSDFLRTYSNPSHQKFQFWGASEDFYKFIQLHNKLINRKLHTREIRVKLEDILPEEKLQKAGEEFINFRKEAPTIPHYFNLLILHSSDKNSLIIKDMLKNNMVFQHSEFLDISEFSTEHIKNRRLLIFISDHNGYIQYSSFSKEMRELMRNVKIFLLAQYSIFPFSFLLPIFKLKQYDYNLFYIRTSKKIFNISINYNYPNKTSITELHNFICRFYEQDKNIN